MIALSGYIAAVMRRRFAYGELDCCTFMADWLMRCGFPDAMADRRGAYATRAEYEALIASEGGIVRSCRRRFAALGLKRVRQAMPGDVCLVRAPILAGAGGGVVYGPTGAIALSERLRAVVTIDLGLVGAELEVVQAWRVAHA